MSKIYIAMLKWCIVLSILSLFPSSNAFSQDTISIQARNIPLEEAFKQIEAQTGLTIYYAKPVLDGSKLVSISLFEASLSAAMDALLDKRNVKWYVKNKAIIITQKQSDRDPSNILYEEHTMPADTAPKITVRGRITGQDKKPLPGVTVQVKGAMQGTTTDAEGKFILTNIPLNTVVAFSAIGFEGKQIRVSTTNPLTIVMNLVIKDIEGVEVFSTGYQNLSKQKATGSFSQLNNELINRKVSTNIFDRITEVTSGLNFNPNKPFNSIQIRGVTTLRANELPLIVVDGFAYDNTLNYDLQQLYDYLNNINPNDVESVTVLKDAAAASIWGARSGNGVIVINTKRARYNQKTKIQLSANINIGEKPRLNEMPLMTSEETIAFEKLLFERDYYRSVEDDGINLKQYTTLIPPIYELMIAGRDGEIPSSKVDSLINIYRQHDVRNDISKYFLQSSVNQQYAISASGGSTNYNYYTSIGYDKNRSDLVGDVSDRFTLRFNNSFRPFRNFEVGIFMVFVQSTDANNGIPYQIFFGGTRPVYNRLADEKGNALPLANSLRTFFTENPGNSNYLDWQYRPLEEMRNNDNLTRRVNARLGGEVKYEFLQGLNIEFKGQYERGYTTERKLFNLQSFTTRNLVNQYLYEDVNSVLKFPIPLNGILDNAITESRIWNTRGQLNFNRRFGNHEINTLAGIEVREARDNYSIARKYGYDIDNATFESRPDYITLYQINPSRTGSVAIPNIDNLIGKLYRFRSYYANAVYTYLEKYTLSASVRQDGANLFGVKTSDKVVPLWSTGVLWNISDESFYQIQWLPELKLRASYGFNGNMKNEATTYATIFHSSSPALISGLNYAWVQTPSNPSLRWERVQILNAGIDFGACNGRVTGSIEYYRKNGLDLINEIQVDPTAYTSSANMSSYMGNGASIKGSGLDISLNIQGIRNRFFNWTTNLLFSSNSERVTSLGDSRLTTLSQGGVYVIEGAGVMVGKPVYALYSYKWAGLDPNTGEPMGYVNGAVVPFEEVLSSTGGIPNTKPENMVYHGQINPRFWGSFRNTFTYRQLSLSANILYKFGHYFRRPSIDYSILYSNMNGHSDYAFRWQKPGDELFTNVPSLPLSVNTNRDDFYKNSEILVERADHIRLQDIRLSYTLSKIIIKSLPFQNISLYAYVDNVGLLWTANKKNIDPEWERYYTNIKPTRTLAFGFTINL